MGTGSSEWDDFVEQLQDPDPNVRLKACRKLAAIGDPEVIPFLRKIYLQDEDERVRKAARDALASFKAMQTGSAAKHLPLSDETLQRLVMGLAILLVVSLVLNGAVIVLGSIGSGDDQDTNTVVDTGVPTARDMLADQLSERLEQTKTDAVNLRQEIAQHNDTGVANCETTYNKPQQFVMTETDQQTYRDLALVTNKLNLILLELQQPQAIWDRICNSGTASMTQGLEALKQLDQLDPQLTETDALLQKAILEPAPTFGPTITPLPTATFTPEPNKPTAIPPTQAPSTTTEPSASATLTLTPTITPTLTNTPLPYPNLDYTEILRSLSSRYTVIGDLQNSYGTGMIDRWQQAQQGTSVSSTFCTLPAWPESFDWTSAQLAELQRPNTADPQLEEAVNLTNDGLALAYQARALYETDCPVNTLLNSAKTGITLAELAANNLREAQQIVETIRRRK